MSVGGKIPHAVIRKMKKNKYIEIIEYQQGVIKALTNALTVLTELLTEEKEWINYITDIGV